jgi:ADP-ribosylglycohydrolase
LGGAVGDALGSCGRFLSVDKAYGDDDRHHPLVFNPGGQDGLTVTAITQMTLFTAEGLLLAKRRVGGNDRDAITAIVFQAYLRWLMTQHEIPENLLLSRHGTCSIVDGILIGFKELHVRRRPDTVSLAVLKQGTMGTLGKPVNDSRGSGAVVRTAPIGLLAPEKMAFELACAVAGTTHGHPSAYLAAGSLGQIIAGVVQGRTVADTADKLMVRLADFGSEAETCRAAVEKARAWHDDGRPPIQSLDSFGPGKTATEVLTIALYCALVGEKDFTKGISLAVGHSGATAHTGALTGSILGALAGESAIPSRFLKPLQLRALILEIAEDLDRVGRFQETLKKRSMDDLDRTLSASVGPE